MAAAAALVSGCDVYVRGTGSVAIDEPAVEVVPPVYTWDGVEYVGEYNGGFYYYGPTGIWIRADPVIIERFHGWEGEHRDWRDHAYRNEGGYRLDRAHHEGPHGPPRNVNSGPRRDAVQHEPARRDAVQHEQPRRDVVQHQPARQAPAPQHAPPRGEKREDDKHDHDNH